MRIGDLYFLNQGYRRTLQFYMTAPAPCPYIEGNQERKAFTTLDIPDVDAVHNALSLSGFRRSQSIAYRPACSNCNACRSVRVPVREFDLSRRWRRVCKQNNDIVTTPARGLASREQYKLLKKYLDARHHDGGMSTMTYRDYVSMVNDCPVQNLIIEYRIGDDPDGVLIGATICDVLRDGLSMVYSFFDPDYAQRSLGTFMILDHIERARELGLPHLYLGYWVKESPKMDYKRQFWPLEILNGEKWDLLEPPKKA